MLGTQSQGEGCTDMLFLRGTEEVVYQWLMDEPITRALRDQALSPSDITSCLFKWPFDELRWMAYPSYWRDDVCVEGHFRTNDTARMFVGWHNDEFCAIPPSLCPVIFCPVSRWWLNEKVTDILRVP